MDDRVQEFMIPKQYSHVRRFLRFGFLASVVVAAGGCVTRPAADDLQFYRTLQSAAVSVLVDGRMHGSGFFVTGDGLVATAAHVVSGKPKRIELLSASMGRLPAKIVAVDASHDSALLAAADPKRTYPALSIVDSPPPPGTTVFLLGNPLFRHDVLLSGTVASDGATYCYSKDLQCYVRSVYIAGPSPKGTSGGCWVDSRGRVIGVQSGYLGEGNASAGLATVGHPDGLIRLLARRRSARTATLGTQLDELWTQPAGFIARFTKGTEGVITVRPHKDGPVAKAGLTKESLVTAVDGRQVRYCDELLDIMRTKRPGQTVTLTVVDPDRKPARKVKIRLAEVAQ